MPRLYFYVCKCKVWWSKCQGRYENDCPLIASKSIWCYMFTYTYGCEPISAPISNPSMNICSTCTNQYMRFSKPCRSRYADGLHEYFYNKLFFFSLLFTSVAYFCLYHGGALFFSSLSSKWFICGQVTNMQKSWFCVYTCVPPTAIASWEIESKWWKLSCSQKTQIRTRANHFYTLVNVVNC